MSAFAKLKAIDFYRKIPRDLTEASFSGASLSIVAATTMIFLFIAELNSFLKVSTTTQVIVDQSQNGELLRINFNFSFPALSCEFASVDVTDVLGTARYNLSKTVRKYPIDAAGNWVGPEHHPDPLPVPEKHGEDSNETTEEVHQKMAEDGHEYVGSLVLNKDNFDHFAHEYQILVVNFFAPWCPWCQRLEPAWEKAATVLNRKYHPDYDGRIRFAKIDCTIYQDVCRDNHIQGFPSIRIFRKGMDLRMHGEHGEHDHESYYGERDAESLVAFAESLVPSATVGRPTAAEDSHQHVKRRAPKSGGCNIEGFVLVKKVPGNLMITAHSTAHSFDAATMNMTHSIHRFSFGRQLTRRKQELVARLRPYVPAPVGRLEGHSFHSNHDNVTHEHFMQIVLTEVHPLGVSRKDSSLHSYDYTAHSHTLQAPTVPVSRFHYELSPMQVLIVETRRPFFHFITNLCAIIGGVFTVAGIIDGMFHNALSMLKKVELGKHRHDMAAVGVSDAVRSPVASPLTSLRSDSRASASRVGFSQGSLLQGQRLAISQRSCEGRERVARGVARAAMRDIPKQFQERHLKEGLMENFRNVPASLYGLNSTQMSMLMTEDSPVSRISQSVTEASISSAAHYRNGTGMWSLPGLENSAARLSMSVSMYRGLGGAGRPKTAPPDLPSLLLDARICYLGMPIVPAVTELIVAELLWLDYDNPSKPIYFYINSSGTQNDKRESVGFETEAYAIADTMNYVKSKVYTVNCGQAFGQAAMLLAIGDKGHRAVQPHAVTKLYAPRASQSSGAAIDMWIKAKELDANTDYYIELLARGTGKSRDELYRDVMRPKYLRGQEAIDYGVCDKIIEPRGVQMEKKNYDELMMQAKAMRARGGRPGAPQTAAPAGGGGAPR
ncbi:unnamed protein product [Closterium sp. Yama58-4]|nr:unnamed protein product [Closterium sp. Yama58-4]